MAQAGPTQVAPALVVEDRRVLRSPKHQNMMSAGVTKEYNFSAIIDILPQLLFPRNNAMSRGMLTTPCGIIALKEDSLKKT